MQTELIASLPEVETGITMTYRVMTREEVEKDLMLFEGRYGITSNEFLRRFYAGEFDEADAISWEFACDLANDMNIRLN